MKQLGRNFIHKILIAVIALFIAIPAFAPDNTVNTSAPTEQTTNNLEDMGHSGDIGDYGRWSTPHNRDLVVGNITRELQSFGPTATDINNSFVPLDAKLGLAFIGGLTNIGIPLDRALTRFAIIFILIAYAFWVAFEAYNLIGSGTDAKETIKNVLLKGLVISAWLIVLDFGIVKLFAMIMMPVVELGTYISHTIWQGITSVVGYSVPDTCDAIKQYAITNIANTLPNTQNETITSGLIDSLKDTSNSTAGLLCIPSQMSAFFVTIIEIGWKMLVSGIGVSLLTFLLGGYITYLALKCIWKFLFITLGVVADLFLGLLLLPFTAIAETTAKTKYKGVAGDIFNSFLDIFKTEKISTQINRIIQAILYFICLGIAIGVSMSLLSFIVNPETGKVFESMQIDGLNGTIIVILSLLLVCYMADKAKSLAENWGGKINTEFGDQVNKDVSRLWTQTKKNWQTFRNLTKKK